MNRTHANRQSKKDLPSRGNPDLRIPKRVKVRCPEKGQPFGRPGNGLFVGPTAIHRLGASTGNNHQPTNRQNRRKQNEQRHSDLCDEFNSFRQPARENENIQPGAECKEEQAPRRNGKDMPRLRSN